MLCYKICADAKNSIVDGQDTAASSSIRLSLSSLSSR